MTHYPLQRRSKRTGEGFSITHELDTGRPSSKKARFDHRNPSTLALDATEVEDPILELDEIGKKGQQSKRNAVQLDGYDSDSSEGNFDARAEAKAEASRRSNRKETKSQDEEINDMFADVDEEFKDSGEDESINKEGKKKIKEVKFLDASEIEGQVVTSKSGGHVSADFSAHWQRSGDGDQDTESSDESADDTVRAELDDKTDKELGAGAKKHKAPKLDAFNMKTEAEEGRFDDSGNFVRKAVDPYAVHDSWLEGSSKADMKRAREAHARREEERRRRDVADDSVSTAAILSTLIGYIENGETVLEAIARLGRSTNRKKPKWQRNKRGNSENMGAFSNTADMATKGLENVTAVEAITEAADQLLTRGQPDIYDAEKALLMRQYRRECGEEWGGEKPPQKHTSSLTQWEYRWTDGRAGDEVYGPFDSNTIQSWVESGYFGEGVELKEVGINGKWISALNFT